MNIWRVKYSTSFDSGHGRHPWDGHGERPHKAGLVATEGDGIESVRDAIRGTFGCQEFLSKLLEAEWLGVTINEIHSEASQTLPDWAADYAPITHSDKINQEPEAPE